MNIEINGDSVRIIGNDGKSAIRIHHNETDDRFGFEICRNGIAYGVLPSVIFYKGDTVIQNNLAAGRHLLKNL